MVGYNTALEDNAINIRAGVCVYYTEAVDVAPDGLKYGVKCLDMVNDNPNNFFIEIFAEGTFPGTEIAEMRSRGTKDGSIAVIYPIDVGVEEAIQRLRNWDFSTTTGLGSTPNTTEPLRITPITSDRAVIAADFLEIALTTDNAINPNRNVFYFAQEDDQRVIDPLNGIVRIPNLGNYPCTNPTDNIVTPIGVGYVMVDDDVGTVFIGCPGGSLLISELILSEAAVIPTLDEWGLIAMAAILGIAGFMVIRRRKVAA